MQAFLDFPGGLEPTHASAAKPLYFPFHADPPLFPLLRS